MNEERVRELYEHAMARRAAEPGGCRIAPETMIDVIAHRLPDAEHRTALLEIMSDPRCRREFELLRAVAGAPQRTRASWATGWPVRIAAAMALVAGSGLLWQTMRSPGGDVVRGSGENGTIMLVSPTAESNAAADRRFAWRTVRGAMRYDYNLATRGGRLLYSATTTDTVSIVPDSVRAKTGEELVWWVEAAMPDGRQMRSAVRRVKMENP